MQETMADDAERSTAAAVAERKDAGAMPTLSQHLRAWQ